VIYFCADDYGLSEEVSFNIQRCIDEGAINKVSVFPNFDKIDFKKITGNKKIRISLHLNLVEGKCMAAEKETGILWDKGGSFKHRFGGLLILSLLRRKELEDALYREIRAQVLFWKSILPGDTAFCIDSHQHTHMIPAVFRALVKVLKDEKITPDYVRIPTEPIMPYLKTPSLYFTYKPINLIKQWLLNFLWLFNKKSAVKEKIPTGYFFGILFSGQMDEKRVKKLLPLYEKLAKKRCMDMEVLFHPGYLTEFKPDFKDKNIVFKDFYLSENRKTEFDSVMKISKGSAINNAIY